MGRRSAAIFCDHAAVAEAAVELLVRHGLLEFGYIGSRHALAARSWDSERREAFCAALARYGLRAAVYLPATGLTPERELASLAAWLRSLRRPCGLLVSDDMRAMHVPNICRVCGFAVPEQIQVIGVDNEEWICDHTSPTLTSVEPERCGSDAPNHFARLFKARTGMTMLQFRRQEGASDFRRPGLRIRARLPR